MMGLSFYDVTFMYNSSSPIIAAAKDISQKTIKQ